MKNIHPRNDNTNRFPIFKELVGELSYNTVFDYGGGSGNLLYFSNGQILEKNYTCLDVSKDAIDSGKDEFPESTWIFHDKFNPMYSHTGVTDTVYPLLDKNQDIIWSYSVLSHMDAAEIIETTLWLNTFNYKKMFLSFLDVDGEEMKNYFYNKRVADYGSCLSEIKNANSKTSNCFYFFDNNKFEINKYECEKVKVKHFLAFYNKDWLLSELEKHGIHANFVKPNNGYVPFLVFEK